MADFSFCANPLQSNKEGAKGSINQLTQQKTRLKKSDFKHRLFIESFGVKICVTTNNAKALDVFREVLRKYLLNFYAEIEETTVEHNFLFVWNQSAKDTLYKNGERIFYRIRRDKSVELLGSHVRRTVAEFADGRVFIHAGVVTWKDKVILIPGTSFSGKTSLTAALVERGAVYYSDEYAILDEEGFIYPFPKTLSVREEDTNNQTEFPAESFGGVTGSGKSRLGMVLITEFSPNARWTPKALTRAEGILEIIKHTVPIRRTPDYVFEVLTKAVKTAAIVKSKRGDVSKFADLILEYYEKTYREAP